MKKIKINLIMTTRQLSVSLENEESANTSKFNDKSFELSVMYDVIDLSSGPKNIGQYKPHDIQKSQQERNAQVIQQKQVNNSFSQQIQKKIEMLIFNDKKKKSNNINTQKFDSQKNVDQHQLYQVQQMQYKNDHRPRDNIKSKMQRKQSNAQQLNQKPPSSEVQLILLKNYGPNSLYTYQCLSALSLRNGLSNQATQNLLKTLQYLKITNDNNKIQSELIKIESQNQNQAQKKQYKKMTPQIENKIKEYIISQNQKGFSKRILSGQRKKIMKEFGCSKSSIKYTQKKIRSSKMLENGVNKLNKKQK